MAASRLAINAIRSSHCLTVCKGPLLSSMLRVAAKPAMTSAKWLPMKRSNGTALSRTTASILL
eukprot:5025150-Karenia_brevis.AAC.1